MRAKPGFLQTRLYEKPRFPLAFSKYHTVLWGAYQTSKNVPRKLDSRKNELSFAFPPATKCFTDFTPASKSKEFPGKLALFQGKLILRKCQLLHSVPQCFSSFFLTFLPEASVQCLYLHHVHHSEIRLQENRMISKWLIFPLKMVLFHSLSLLPSSRNCFPRKSEFDCICVKYKYKSYLFSNECAIASMKHWTK